MAKNKVSFWTKLEGLLNGVNHLLIFLTATFFFVLARSLNFEGTALHMCLTGLGFHVLMAEALMSHYPANPITRYFSHRNKSRYHGLFQLLGGSMALVGVLGKISQKEVHFTSWHGRLGLLATFFCSASLLGGFVNFFQPTFALKVFTRSEMRYRHNLFGLIPFSLGMATIYLGYYTKFFTRYVDHQFIPAMMLVTVMVYLLTIIGPTQSLLTKIQYRRHVKAK